MHLRSSLPFWMADVELVFNYYGIADGVVSCNYVTYLYVLTGNLWEIDHKGLSHKSVESSRSQFVHTEILRYILFTQRPRPDLNLVLLPLWVLGYISGFSPKPVYAHPEISKTSFRI